jgi:hypothetical protein
LTIAGRSERIKLSERRKNMVTAGLVGLGLGIVLGLLAPVLWNKLTEKVNKL